MKTYTYIGKFDTELLRTDILTQYPNWRQVNGVSIYESYGIQYDGHILILLLPDDANDSLISQIVDRNDPAGVTLEVYWQNYRNARLNFQALPGWSTWTDQEVNDNITNMVLTGQTKQQVEDWIDANVTNITTARTALKILAGAIIDIRTILIVMGKMLVWLRDIVVRR